MSFITDNHRLCEVSNAIILPFANQLFLDGTYQIRFGKNANALKTINGIEAYWMRFYVTTNITIPDATYIKLHSDRTEIKRDGYLELFGKAQKRVAFPYNINIARPARNSPSNQDFYVDGTVSLGRTENLFDSKTTDEIAFLVETPPNMDTSKPFNVLIRYVLKDPASGGPGNILMRVKTVRLTDVQDESGTYSDLSTSSLSTATVAPGLMEEQNILISNDQVYDRIKSLNVSLNVKNIIPRRKNGSRSGDIIAIGISRRGMSSQDTTTAEFAIVSVVPTYVIWCDGNHLSSEI